MQAFNRNSFIGNFKLKTVENNSKLIVSKG